MQIIKLEKTALDGKTELPEADVIVRMTQREYSILNFLAVRNDIEIANANANRNAPQNNQQ